MLPNLIKNYYKLMQRLPLKLKKKNEQIKK